jgi:predicted Zn finger-like uncharacterized protein
VIIACPSCGARFNLDPAKLLPAGRNVRCAKCGHGWREMPAGYSGGMEPRASDFQPAGSEPAQPEPGAPPAAPEPAVEAAAPPPEEAEPHPPTPPETAAEMAQSLAAIAEQVAGARPEGYTVSQGASQGAPQGDPNPIARLARRTAVPGPITVPPRMKPMRPAKRSSHLGPILVAGLVVGLLIAGYAFRDVIARSVPGADVIYALFGFATDNAAADLEISIDNAKINTDEASGRKIFDLRATIFNVSAYPVDMPSLMVIPVDDAGSPLEPMEFRLEEPVIAPGQNIKFRKSFEDWPPTAPNFELRWAHAG